MTPELGPWIWLAAVPLVLAVATAFTKVSVVLGALRVGLGAESLLPWSAMWALAVVLTVVVMGPVAADAFAVVQRIGGLPALSDGTTTPAQWTEVAGPLLEFLGRHAAPDEVEFFAGFQEVGASDPRALVPAFLVTELTEGLHMAVLVLLPLVVVDLVVAQLLSLLGLSAAPGPLVTLPLKLLLFLAAGGWDVVIRGLLEGYA